MLLLIGSFLLLMLVGAPVAVSMATAVRRTLEASGIRLTPFVTD